MVRSAFIASCSGLALSSDEKTFMRQAQPWGLILFGRNIDSPDQVRSLVSSFRSTVGWDAPILIDQEGGRVARLRPPHWPRFPAAERMGDLYERNPTLAQEAVYLETTLMGSELLALGIDVDCMPVLDLRFPDASGVIGDRSYAESPEVVSYLGRVACAGLLQSGVLPVLKHIPGHGRALVDSHDALPFVDASADLLAETDCAPFSCLSDMPIAMCAHVVYEAWDSRRAATESPIVIGKVIRDGIGFDGLLITDDIGMGALSGSLSSRSQAAWDAGCDLVLYCGGELDAMRSIAEIAPRIAGKTRIRCESALLRRERGVSDSELESMRRRYDTLMKDAGLPDLNG